ncbi:partial putative D,D-dipeptide-binding periplasmic protein DdpA, partial [Methylococcales bacterium]
PVTSATTVPAVIKTAPSSSKLRIMSRRAGSISILDGRRWSYPDVSIHLFDAMTRYDANGKLQGRLAESWEQVDPTTWRFKLRQGVKFQNGEAWNAEAFKYNMEMYAKLDPPWAYISYFQGAWPLNVTVESAYSALVKTTTPQPRIPRIMTRMGIVPPVASQATNFADNPVGSGSYRLVQWDKTKIAVIEANQDYWDGAPKINRLEFTLGPDDGTRIAAFQAGEVDVIWEVPYDRVKDLTSKFNVLQAPTWGLYYMALNCGAKSPLGDVRVRQALRYAIDHQGIRDSLLAGQGEMLKGTIPSAIPDSIDAGGFPKRDVAMAKKLLADAGQSQGFGLNLLIQPGEFSKDREICEAIIAQLDEVGVKVKYNEVDNATLKARQTDGNYDMFPNAIYNWVGDTPYYVSVFKTNGYTISKTADDLLVQSNAVEGAQRSALVQKAMKQVWDDAYQLWAVGRTASIGMVKNLQGASYLPCNFLLFDKAQLTS